MNEALKNKKVLLINPAKQDNFNVSRIHMGLTLMGQILVSNRCIVKIMDYAFLRDLKDKIKVPSIEEVIEEFKPDVIGISVFTYVYNECQAMIERISKRSDAPIILGGPHFTMFPEDFSRDKRISYIIRGEAERVILNLVATAKRQELPVLINAPLPSAEEIPAINLDIAFGHEYLSVYQIQLSRGCPYNCSFCNIRFVAGRRVRTRNLELCLNQIIEAKRRHPNIKVITITDDCPMVDKEHFKQFLLMFRQANTGCKLMIDNIRANLIDEEIIKLYAKAGGQHICLGAESGHPEVFKLINKGESLEDIRRTAELVRKNNLSLGLCFVIGLPGDKLKLHLSSIKFAKSLKPYYIF